MLRIAVYLYLLFSTFSVVGFFLPVYFTHKGLNPGEIGTILAGASFVSIFAQPFWGFVSDKQKTVKKILLLTMFAAFFLSIGFFSSDTLLWISVFYFIYAFFSSPLGPLSETLCISYAHQHNTEFGRLRLWGEVGVGTSAFAFGFIVQYIGIDYSWLIYLIILSFAIVAAFRLPDSKLTSAPVNLLALGKLFTQKKLLWFLLLVLLVSIPHRMNDSMFSIYLKELGGSESQLGLAWFLATTSSIPALIYVGKLIQRWNELGIFFVAATIYVIRWIIYSLADSPSVLIAFQLLNSLTFPLFLVACVSYMTSIVPPELRATGLAAFSVTLGGFGGIIGNAGGGYVIEQFGGQTAYSIGAVLAALGAIGALGTNIYNIRKSNQLSLKSLVK
ncbi:MAG: MFS transporter [Paenibacillaceae bacterium]